MAILKSIDYKLKMALRWDDLEDIVYDMTFLWDGHPIINDEILKKIMIGGTKLSLPAFSSVNTLNSDLLNFSRIC